MRVNISYSVKLDELLSHLHRLYAVEETNFRLQVEKLHEILGKSYNDEELVAIIQAIKNYRELIASFDVKLSEMSSILDGYYKIKFEPSVSIEDAEIEVEEKDNE